MAAWWQEHRGMGLECLHFSRPGGLTGRPAFFSPLPGLRRQRERSQGLCGDQVCPGIAPPWSSGYSRDGGYSGKRRNIVIRAKCDDHGCADCPAVITQPITRSHRENQSVTSVQHNQHRSRATNRSAEPYSTFRRWHLRRIWS